MLRNIFSLFLAIGLVCTLQAQTYSFYFDNGSGSLSMANPGGITTNKEGKVFVVASNNVYIFDAIGKYIKRFGEYGTSNGKFNTPFGIKIDEFENIYVADRANHRVQKFNPLGYHIKTFGSDGEFDFPYDLAIDSAGNIFVSDAANHRVQKFDSAGNYLRQFGIPGTGDGEFNYTYALAIDRSNNIFVADVGNHRIQKFDREGNYLLQFGSLGNGPAEFDYTSDITIDSLGNIWVTDFHNFRVQRFDSLGNYLSEFETIGFEDKKFKPKGITISPIGGIYISDYIYNKVQVFDSPFVGIKTTKLNENIEIFPNPAVNEITLKSGFFLDGHLKVIDFSGKELYTEPISGKGTQQINISSLPSGLYLLVVENEEGVFREKLVKK